MNTEAYKGNFNKFKRRRILNAKELMSSLSLSGIIRTGSMGLISACNIKAPLEIQLQSYSKIINGEQNGFE